MICELAELGFGQIELSHGIRMTLVPGIVKALEEKIVSVSSVHNFCPLPSGVQFAAPNFYQPSAPRGGERALWKNYTLKTLEFGGMVGAKVVVLHSGSAFFFFRSPTGRLEAREAGVTGAEGADFRSLRENADYRKELEKVMKRMRKKAKKMCGRVIAAFREVLDAAEERGLQLGVENRESLVEFPLDEQIPEFLESVSPKPVVRYWHDTGHAQIKHLQGLIEHEALLDANHDRLAGLHLHDVTSDGRDHREIGTGTVDFKMVARYVKPEHLLVMEFNPRLTAEEIIRSKHYLEDVLG